MKKIFYTTIFLSVAVIASSQMVQKSSQGKFLLKNATLHTITKGIMEADLLIEGNHIAEIAADIQAEDAVIIQCEGKQVYPGFIDGGTQLGLHEIRSISLTKDYDEHGEFTPHMDALTAVNPNSVNIPVSRVNGITTVLTSPKGNMFPGQATVIHLHGYTPKQMFAGQKFQSFIYPSTGRRNSSDRRTDEEIEKEGKKKMEKLNDFWGKAVQHAKIDSAAYKNNEQVDYNPQLDAMKEVIRGNQKLIIEVNKKSDILKAVEWVNKQKIDAIFSGVAEGWRVADTLAKYNIPVIVGPVLKLPSRDADRYDKPYRNAGILQAAGVLVAIRTDEYANVRNLPYNAAFAANYGLGIEEALKAVTINPAKIFGIEESVGSLEEGKLANLFICDGDPFETKTQISHLFIGGWNVPMESRHTLLYDEFLERSPGIPE